MTAQDINAFASAHGVQIHPRIYKGFGSVEAFASETGGMCPSIPGRSCPCQESLAELSSPSAMDQHCSGYLFVTPAYVKEVDPRGKVYGDVSAPSSQPVVDDEVSSIVKGYLPEIDAAIKLFASDDHEGSFDKLVDLAESTDCDVCKEQFMTEAIHVNNARNLCDLPYVGGCSEEKARVKARLDKMRAFFDRAAGGNGEPPKQTRSSPYREAMADWMKSSELEPYPQKARFFMATQLAGGKASTVEEAMESALSSHPEWFQ